MAGISRESVPLISALLKCLIYAISENCSFGKALIKLLYLPNVFVFFINVDHFVIIEKGINLSQYRRTAGMFNNIFANKRCNKNSICYLRKIQSCEFGLTMIFFILLHAFPILIGFLKTISRKNMQIVHINKKFLISCFYLFSSYSYLYHIWLFPRLMHLSGDIEKNPGPQKDFSQTFSIGHWNLNSLVAHNFTKIALLKAYLPVQKFDIFRISETYLNSSIAKDDDSLRIPGYSLIRSDHPSNNKRGGVAIYYKHFLPLKLIDVNYLRESILSELQIGSKICNFISLYRSPSQTGDNFDSFLDNLKLNLDAMTDNNPFLVVAIGDFNARSSSWCISDKSNYEGTKIDCLATEYDLKQVFQEPTHLLENSSFCIDLIFTSQPNLVMDPGVHPSLHANSHHQIVYPKFNLKIHYPPPYEREVWHFHKADINQLYGQEQ